jgi:hypothetical protein
VSSQFQCFPEDFWKSWVEYLIVHSSFTWCKILTISSRHILYQNINLTHEHVGQLPEGPLLICVCCVQHVFKCLNTDFVGSTNTINICLILSTLTVLFLWRPPLNVDGECPPLLQSRKGNLRKFILKARIKSSFVLCFHSIMYRLIADCWYQYNKYMFNFIDIDSFILMSGCVGRFSVQLFSSYIMARTSCILMRWCPLWTWLGGLVWFL